MKRLLMLFLIFALAVSFGCSKKEREKEKTFERGISRRPRKVAFVDPVSKNMVDPRTSPYSYIYEGVSYNFESKENMDKFVKDPEKYLEEMRLHREKGRAAAGDTASDRTQD